MRHLRLCQPVSVNRRLYSSSSHVKRDTKESPTAVEVSSRPHRVVEQVIRASHAGELGADRISTGQAAILGKSTVGPTIKVTAGGYIIIVYMYIHVHVYYTNFVPCLY